MLTLDNKKYSREPFDGYTHLAEVRVTTIRNFPNKHKVTLYIYTTDDNMSSVENVMLDRRHEDVTSITVVELRTYEQVQKHKEFIDEFLNDIQK
jgi:hypothetical protein